MERLCLPSGDVPAGSAIPLALPALRTVTNNPKGAGWGCACAQAGYELFDQPQEVIDLTFGGVTLVTAIVATLLGGVFIDLVGSSVRNSMRFCGWTALASLNLSGSPSLLA